MDSRNGPHLKAALLPLPTELPLLKPDERLLARLHIVDFCLFVQSSRSASWIDRIGLSVTGNLGGNLRMLNNDHRRSKHFHHDLEMEGDVTKRRRPGISNDECGEAAERGKCGAQFCGHWLKTAGA